MTFNKKWWRLINWSLFFILLIEIFIPAFYSLIRVSILARIDGTESVYIGSLSQYTSLLYFVFKDAFILSLYFYLGKNLTRYNSASVIKSVFFVTMSILLVCGIIITIFLEPIVYNSEIPNNTSDIDLTIQYLYISTWTIILKTITFVIFILIIFSKKNNYLIYIIVFRVISLFTLDMIFFIPLTSPFQLGVLGYAISDFISEFLVIIFGIYLLLKAYEISFYDLLISKMWNNKKNFYRVSGWSASESLIRNIGYFLVILGLSQMMGDEGAIIWYITIIMYWSFLLVPLYAMQEDIKLKTGQETHSIEEQRKILFAYHMLAIVFFFLWILLLPFIYFFIGVMLNMQSGDSDLYNTIFISFLILLIPQFCYMITRIWDQVLYAKGETKILFYRTLFTTVLVFLPVFLILKINPEFIIGENADNYISVSIIYGIFLLSEFSFVFIIYKYLNNKYFSKTSNIKHNWNFDYILRI